MHSLIRMIHDRTHIVSILLILLILSAGLLAACTGGRVPAETETTGYHTVPTADATEPETDPGATSEEETDAESEPVPETETVYDILKPTVVDPENADYFNVKKYGAKGDGKTDDSAAIAKCLGEAFDKSGVVFFPKGDYLVTRTLTVPKNDGKVLRLLGNGATVIGDEALKGAILDVDMKYNFFVDNLDFVHKGEGSCISALFLQAKWCRFAADAENPADTVVFNGSNCRVTECSFDVANPDVYALAYVRIIDEISINDFIIDNVFRGASKGVLVGNGVAAAYGRAEGLKINDNYFYNTGSEQVRVAEILHCQIGNNTFRNGTGTAIVLTSAGLGPDGVYISHNSIVMGEGAHACIATVEGGENYVSSVNINNNHLVGGEYGVYDPIIIYRAFVRENVFEGQSKAGYAISKRNFPTTYMLMDNVIDLPEGVNSVEFPWRVIPTFVRNVVGVTSVYPDRLEAEFKAGTITRAEKGRNVTVLPPYTGEAGGNAYDGMEFNDDYEYIEETVPKAEDIQVPEGAVNRPLSNMNGARDRAAVQVDGTIAARFTAEEAFYGVTVINPSWGDSIGSLYVSLYKWQGTYDSTLDSTPVLGAEWINFKDNNHNRILTATPLEAGEYLLLLMSEPGKSYQMVGCWAHKQDHPVQTEAYINGALQPGLEITESTIHYAKEPGT